MSVHCNFLNYNAYLFSKFHVLRKFHWSLIELQIQTVHLAIVMIIIIQLLCSNLYLLRIKNNKWSYLFLKSLRLVCVNVKRLIWTLFYWYITFPTLPLDNVWKMYMILFPKKLIITRIESLTFSGALVSKFWKTKQMCAQKKSDRP